MNKLAKNLFFIFLLAPSQSWALPSTAQDQIVRFIQEIPLRFFNFSILIAFGFFFLVTIFGFFSYRKKTLLQQEVAHRKQVEAETLEKGKNLEKALALSKATLEATADGILVVDKERRIVGYNQRFRKMWKIPESILKPGNDEEAAKFVLSQVKDPEQFIKNLERFYNLEPGKEVIGLVEFKDGRIFERFTMPQVYNDEIIGRVFSFRDATKRLQMEQQLLHQATHDTLTTLPNRIILLDRIAQAIKNSNRTNKIGALLFFDLDQFKLVNDSLGHDIGDILLQSVSKRLEACARENDTVSRWGGDEFVILLTDLFKEEDVIPIVTKCLHELETVFVVDKYHLSITSSVGISFFPKDGQNAITLLKNADSAMYYAKSEGRNNFKFYTPQMSARTKKQLKLANDLHEALEKNELSLHYQPLVDLKNGSIVGAEALLRWNHPDRGMVPAQDFIPVAEDTGLILPIGEWVLRTACQQIKTWQDEGLSPIIVAINLSGQQFKQRNIGDLVKDVLEKTQLSPKYLELELTESTIMDNTELYMKAMHVLKEIGVGLVIDDFGTGYSSLSYLKRFPVDKIKIDKEFVAGLPKDNDDAAIVRAILAMASQLNLKVVAEGIETKKQLAFLQEYTCDMGQGFLFSKAIPPEEFALLLKENHVFLEQPYFPQKKDTSYVSRGWL